MSRRERILRGLKGFFYAQCCLAFMLFGLRMAMAHSLQSGIDYMTPQDQPLLAPEPISLVGEMEGRLYVLFEDTAAVNVYDGNGQFLWSVSVPYHDHNGGARMLLKEGKLYIYQRDWQVYCYRGTDGRFLEFFDRELRSEEFPVERRLTKPVKEEEIREGNIYFSGLKVYRAGEGGALIPIIVRPWWIKFLYFIVPWILGFFGGIALFALERLGPLFLQRERTGKKKWEPGDPALLRFYKRARLTVRLNLAYVVGNVIDALFFRSHYLCIGIMALGVWFILFSHVRVKGLIPTEEDRAQMSAWEGYLWLSMFAAFFSVVLNVMV